MTDEDILNLAAKHNVIAFKHITFKEGKRLHIDDRLDGDGAGLIMFARELIQIAEDNFKNCHHQENGIFS